MTLACWLIPRLTEALVHSSPILAKGVNAPHMKLLSRRRCYWPWLLASPQDSSQTKCFKVLLLSVCCLDRVIIPLIDVNQRNETGSEIQDKEARLDLGNRFSSLSSLFRKKETELIHNIVSMDTGFLGLFRSL
jgi:hypothetical protein